jgi:Holliday junction DNA helicase RuvA
MISRVKGVLLRRDLGMVEVMTPGGVAYELQIPLTVYERLPREGGEIEFRTWLVIREDAHELYGFLEEHERRVFARMLTATGVGPRLALNMLSSMRPDRLVRAIADRDLAALRQIPGLGAKKAERLALELADKLDDLAVAAVAARPEGRAAEDAVGALVQLGYSAGDAAQAVRRALDQGGPLVGVELIKAALSGMTNNG